MPELPEVETIRLQLLPLLSNKTLSSISVLNEKSFYGDKAFIIGKQIKTLSRRGKVLIIEFNDTACIFIHLKMSGQLIYEKKKKLVVTGSKRRYGMGKGGRVLDTSVLPNKHTRVFFTFNTGDILFFNDIRKFGWIIIGSYDNPPPIFKTLGVEPFDNGFSHKILEITAHSKIPIKQLLLDQTKIAGIGNIYASEALFCAKIAPNSPSNTIKMDKISKLAECIKLVLMEGIKRGGSSFSTYRDTKGKKGSMQHHFAVYDREDKECINNCGEKIKRIVIGGRSTFFCPKCQK